MNYSDGKMTFYDINNIDFKEITANLMKLSVYINRTSDRISSPYHISKQTYLIAKSSKIAKY